MGTSSLYKGPKKTVLLPSDYEPVDNFNQSPVDNTPDEIIPDCDDAENGTPSQESSSSPDVSWSTARSSVRKAMNNRSVVNVKRAISNYTKALGGHTNAMRQAAKVRKTANVLYTLFAGSPEVIRRRLEEVGISFEGRPTKDIFNDICISIAPIPNDFEDALVNKSLYETFSDIAADQSIDLNQLDNFNEDLLQRLVGGLIKHYIFNKLIFQSEQTALKNCEHVNDLQDLEKSIKQYIDGIVDSVVPDLVKSGINPSDFNRVLETLCDICYQQMEDL